jgi:uncharacterized protein YoxC
MTAIAARAAETGGKVCGRARWLRARPAACDQAARPGRATGPAALVKLLLEERAPMSAGQVAALIAAGFFGLLACAGIYVLLRLGRLVKVATQVATSYRDRADTLLDQAQAVVDRTNEQLTRTDSITASMDQVTANMAELSGNVSVLAAFARGLAGAVSAPVTGLAALSYGVRHAVGLRRPDAVPPHLAPAVDQPARPAQPARPVPSARAGEPAALPARASAPSRAAR